MKDKYSMNYCCNECDRGFTNEKAWQHHGASTGHNINGDLSPKHQREIGELNAKIEKLQTAYRLVSEELGQKSAALRAITCTLELIRYRQSDERGTL